MSVIITGALIWLLASSDAQFHCLSVAICTAAVWIHACQDMSLNLFVPLYVSSVLTGCWILSHASPLECHEEEEDPTTSPVVTILTFQFTLKRHLLHWLYQWLTALFKASQNYFNNPVLEPLFLFYFIFCLKSRQRFKPDNVSQVLSFPARCVLVKLLHSIQKMCFWVKFCQAELHKTRLISLADPGNQPPCMLLLFSERNMKWIH